MPANYNKTAWFYDRLARLVYGDSLHKAQIYLLKYLPPNSKILIIGGGTGRILEAISATYLAGLTIIYVELSANMISLSRKRNIGNNTVEFINAAIEEIDTPGEFDVIITPFLFDNYTNEALQTTFPHTNSQLKPGGIWLNTDFQLTGKWWQWVLMKGMYAFFKLFSEIDASRFPDVKSCFLNEGYVLIEGKEFYGRFLLAQGWRKASPKSSPKERT
ncbi:MAG: class I SAM-dependent methyltransferase [Mucilaginibacter sp.]